MKHVNGDCPSCKSKLWECHPDIVSFVFWVWQTHPDAHISWAFRDQAEQDLMYSYGKSLAKWGQSPHNFMKDGSPYSKAVDLFRLDEQGGHWDMPFFFAIAKEANEAAQPVVWGGTFRHLKDLDHWELKDA